MVFNVEQCDGLTLPALPVAEAVEWDPLAWCEHIVAGYPNPPAIDNGGDGACYMHHADRVRMPLRTQFPEAADYYATLFHELGHSTGHETRLNRTTLTATGPFGDVDYSREELVAEMTAAFLCGEAGILNNVAEATAAYIAGWRQALIDEPTWLVSAAAHAQRAADHILARPAEHNHPQPASKVVAP